jgi:hypothetical protein
MYIHRIYDYVKRSGTYANVPAHALKRGLAVVSRARIV